MKARGNTRAILEKVGHMQNLVGSAIGHHQDDQNPNSYEIVQKQLDEAMKLCVEIRSMYDPF